MTRFAHFNISRANAAHADIRLCSGLFFSLFLLAQGESLGCNIIGTNVARFQKKRGFAVLFVYWTPALARMRQDFSPRSK